MLRTLADGGFMQIDPKHLMIIAEISDAGGFTEAAVSLGTSQPAISRVVKMLEQRLGEPIFHRVRKPLQLTSAGAILADQGRAIRTAAPGVGAALAISSLPCALLGKANGKLQRSSNSGPSELLSLRRISCCGNRQSGAAFQRDDCL
jgi:hypothetical protein